MGDVIAIPFAETVHLRGLALSKTVQILTKMLSLASQFQRVCVGERESLNDQLVELQAELSRWQMRLEGISDVMDAVHEKRVEIWAAMPEGINTVILADEKNGNRRLEFSAQRSCSIVYCTDLEIFERDADGQMKKVGLCA